MSATIDEALAVDIVADAAVRTDREVWERNRADIMAANREASEVDHEALAAFLDLLAAADTDYIDAEAYVPEPEAPALDWDAVSQALGESQAILIGVQRLLSETLAGMGVADHQSVRVYADTAGCLRLVADHPRRAEIESALNSPENRELRDLYQAATSGMSLAGSLVGNFAVPEEVLARVKAKQSAA